MNRLYEEERKMVVAMQINDSHKGMQESDYGSAGLYRRGKYDQAEDKLRDAKEVRQAHIFQTGCVSPGSRKEI